MVIFRTSSFFLSFFVAGHLTKFVKPIMSVASEATIRRLIARAAREQELGYFAPEIVPFVAQWHAARPFMSLRELEYNVWAAMEELDADTDVFLLADIQASMRFQEDA